MSFINWSSKEINRIIKITDAEEHEKQNELLCAVLDKKNEYDFYVLDYKKRLLIKDMEHRGILIQNVDISQQEIMKSWEKAFANRLTAEEKDNIYFNQFMWHVFSFEKIEALVRTKARQAFNKIKKNHVYIFYQNRDDVFYVDNAANLKAADFDMEQDVYVADSNMMWTYVHTHEMQCGPYFMRAI